MTQCSNREILAAVHERIKQMDCVRTRAGAQYEFGYMNVWIGALSWAHLIDGKGCENLRAQMDQAYARTLTRLNELGAPGFQAALIQAQGSQPSA
ncbi:hypothetical protein HDC30_002481 [Pseudomonas sp. JAI115]|uniref:hypothetical protein n=1 Tax=Pseudomonas sp. JAI115 TaxID=2723061 RepID=UPI001609EB91|nr:hypothetical protein [Pseudomonas sp. JAI115]MBB6155258.1 hypothetical protein [Pseudomonas sp. JAI115]